MVGFIAALALLAAMGVLGVTLLRRAVGCLEPLEYTAYGIPLGAVIVSLAIVPLATLFGFSTVLVVVIGAISTLAAILLLPVPLPWASLHAAGRSVCHSLTANRHSQRSSRYPALRQPRG